MKNDPASEVPIRVVNKHRASAEEKRRAIYIGRGSPLGNPFKVKPHGPHERGTTLSLYEEHLRGEIENENPDVCGALNQIWKRARNAQRSGGDVLLMCFCRPKRCHEDVVKAVVAEQLQAVSNESAAADRPASASDQRSGYYLMGGYAARGRGSAEGAEKDRAMRRVADGAIVELADPKRPSSTRTTIRALGAPSFQNAGEVVMLALGRVAPRPVASGEDAPAHQASTRERRAVRRGRHARRGRADDSPAPGRIGALYCIYHAGPAPRIDVTPLREASASGRC